MKKNILMVIGSPRKLGNSRMMAAEFTAGAEERGHIVSQFDVIENEIKGCTACENCWSKGKPCIFNDGFNKFADMLEDTDVLVFATPVYWGTFPAQLKALVDKMYAFVGPWFEKELKKKEMVLLTCGDGDDESAFAITKTLYKELGDYMGWNFDKSLCVPKLSEPGDVRNTYALAEARNMGRSI